jgi:SAM-dependent methyltransferase
VQVADLGQCFSDLGWGPDWRTDTHASNVFNLMKSAHDFVTPDHIVLDVSAGEAKYKPFYHHGHYVALDSTVGDKNWDYSRLDIVADAMHLPIRTASVDAVLNFTSLEHYPEPAAFFAEVSRVLKPGGKLFLFVPHFYEEHQQPYDFYRYTQYGLRYLCERNGLTVDAVDPVCNVAYSACSGIQVLINSLQKLGGNDALCQQLANTKTSLKALSVQLDQILAANPAAAAVVSQMPLLYTLRAGKPGILRTEPHPVDRIALLNQIMADPFEKKPITWDGVSEYISAELSNRRYPVIAGIPRFMS